MGRIDMAAVSSPIVYVIAGPNGAGKTTFAMDFFPEFVQCREFVNADLIAAGLSPFAPETQAMRAGRLVLVRIKELERSAEDFAFETTLAGRSYAKLISDLGSPATTSSCSLCGSRVPTRPSRGSPIVSAKAAMTFQMRRYAVDSRLGYTTSFDCTPLSWIRGICIMATELPPRLIASNVNGTAD